MTKNITIFGAGGLGREVLALIRALPEWRVIGFFDDAVKKGTLINEVEVLGDRNTLLSWPEPVSVVFAIGRPEIKKALGSFLKKSSNLSYPTLIHPRAIILEPERVALSEGVILTAGCIITTNVTIGKHVLVNLNATIGHDSVIEAYSSIMPGVNLAGAVKIGEAVLLGSGANILPEISVGKGSIIGAGAVVNQHIGEYETAVGVPAKAIVKKS